MTDDAGPILDLQSFVLANEHWVREFSWAELGVRPRRRMAILTCMDSRYTAQGVLGVALGDAHVVRNAGGRVTEDVIRSLVLSAHALGTRGCVVMHHTNCGLHGISNDELRARVAAVTGEDASRIDFLPFADTVESVREDLRLLRTCGLLPADYELLGFVYDVATGRLQPVTDEA